MNEDKIINFCFLKIQALNSQLYIIKWYLYYLISELKINTIFIIKQNYKDNDHYYNN
jgi:hypothetical protein